MSKNNDTLYGLGEEYRELEYLLAENDGDVSDDEFEAKIDAWFADLNNRVEIKLDGYARYIRELESNAERRSNEAGRLLSLAAEDERKSAKMKTRLKSFMEMRDLKTVNTERFKLSVTNNGGKLPMIVDPAVEAHPQELPERYHRVKFEVNRETIYEDLKNGEELDFATLGIRGTHLRIK